MDYLTHINGISDEWNVFDALKFYVVVKRGNGEDVNRAIKLLGLGELAHAYPQLSQG
jgi:ABC-type transport system involved in cytochrome c biogenesis ATPase subunit